VWYFQCLTSSPPFQTASRAPRTFHGLLAFAVDLGGNIRHVDFLSLGINGSSWRITNDVL